MARQFRAFLYEGIYTMSKIDLKNLTKSITSIKNRASSLRKDVQSSGLDTLSAIADYDGNCEFVTALADAIGKGSNRAAFVTWVVQNSPLETKPTKETTKTRFTINGKHYVFGLEKGWTPAKIRAAVATMADLPWFDAIREPQAVDLTFDKFVKRMSALETLVAKAVDEKRVTPDELAKIQPHLDKLVAIIPAA